MRKTAARERRFPCLVQKRYDTVMRVRPIFILCVPVWLAACGGGQKPAEEPVADSSAEESEDSNEAADAAADAKPDGKSEGAGDKPGEAKEDKNEKKDDAASTDTSGPQVKRTVRDILTAPDVIFMFSFNQSDIKDAAEKQCDGEGTGNPKQRAKCMARAKQKIDVDGIALKQEKGKWYFLAFRRRGRALVNLHKVPIEFTKEEERSIVLKPIGADEGSARGAAPTETKIEVPNEYEIVIQDPKLGRMVYEAKIGLTDK